MKIKTYEVLINEKEGQCGILIDLSKYKISFLKEKELFYEIKKEERIINILSGDNDILITILNIDQELIYYAFKTIVLGIFGAKMSPQKEIKLIMSAELK